MFDPTLPNDKVEAIDKIGFGVVDKIFLEFDSSPWGTVDDVHGMEFLFNDSGISYSAQEADNDWTRFLLGAYIEDKFLLGNYDEAFKDKIVSLWLSGEGAKKMESLDIDQVKSDTMKMLRRMTKNINNN